MKRKTGPSQDRGDTALRRRLTFAIPLLTLLVFAPVAGNEFVRLDDAHVITANSRVRAGLSLDSLRWAFTSAEDANWFPVTRIGYLLNVEIFGLWPGGHHLASVVVHAASAALLFLALAGATGALWPSAFTAAVFAIHPLRVESVAWSTELSDVLATFFFMASLRWYVNWSSSRRRRDYLAVSLLFALGLMSKPTVVTLPLVFLLLDFWPLGRRATGWRALTLEKAPLLALSLGAGLMTLATQRAAGAVATLSSYPLEVRLMTAALSTAGYLGKLLFPLGLSPFYVHPGADISRPASLAAALFLGVVTAWALARLRSSPWLAAGWGWYLVMLAPVSGLVQTGHQGMADRFTYLPLVGVVIAASWELRERLAKGKKGRVTLLAGGTAFLLGCLLLTPLQVRRWRDTRTLFTHALNLDPYNWLAHLKLAETARGEGRYGEAIPHLERTVELDPGNVYARTLLGVTLGKIGRGEEAVGVLREAVRRGPNWADARHNLAVALAGEGLTREAISHLRAELLLKPGTVRPHSMLAALLFLTGETEEAERHCRRWLELEPRSRKARFLLDSILEARRHPSPESPAAPEVPHPSF